jgi:hypothetical protein
VQVWVGVDDDSGDEIRSLWNWLAEESAVRRYGQLHGVGEPTSGTMGSVELLSLVVGSGLSLAHLMTIILTWRAARPKPYLLRVRVGNRSIEVRADDPRDASALARDLEASIVGDPEAS